VAANTARRRAWAAAAARHSALPEPITHYTVLATIETAYTLPRDVRAFTVARITNIWLP
jgi:hypothetical protein